MKSETHSEKSMTNSSKKQSESYMSSSNYEKDCAEQALYHVRTAIKILRQYRVSSGNTVPVIVPLLMAQHKLEDKIGNRSVHSKQ